MNAVYLYNKYTTVKLIFKNYQMTSPQVDLFVLNSTGKHVE